MPSLPGTNVEFCPVPPFRFRANAFYVHTFGWFPPLLTWFFLVDCWFESISPSVQIHRYIVYIIVTGYSSLTNYPPVPQLVEKETVHFFIHGNQETRCLHLVNFPLVVVYLRLYFHYWWSDSFVGCFTHRQDPWSRRRYQKIAWKRG